MTLDLLADSAAIGDVLFGQCDRVVTTGNSLLADAKARAAGKTVEPVASSGDTALVADAKRRRRAAQANQSDDTNPLVRNAKARAAATK